MIWRRIRPTVVLAEMGLILICLGAMWWNQKEIGIAAVTGIIAIAKDIVQSEDKVTEHESKNGELHA